MTTLRGTDAPRAVTLAGMCFRERPTGTSANQRWLTVFDLSFAAATVATASAINVTQGNMVGVLLAAGDGNSVALQSAAAAGTPATGTISYSVPAGPVHHVIMDLAPNNGYSVRVTSSGSSRTISVTPGGACISSPKGVLDFNVSAGDTATPRNAPPPRGNPPMPAYPAGG